MPELPEVEVVRQSLHKKINKKKIPLMVDLIKSVTKNKKLKIRW